MEILKYIEILDLLWKKEVNINMIFMIIFWLFIIIAILLWLLNLKIKDKKLDSFVGFFVFMQFVFLILAIATKDPVFGTIGIPVGYEWVVGLSAGGFGLWFYYLNPLKNRVIDTEKRVEGIDTKVNEIKNDVGWIKSNCNISLKIK